MSDYNRNRSGGGGGGRGGRSFGGGGGGRSGGAGRDSGRTGFGGRGGRDGDRPQMHKTICTDCGAACEVPFKPSGDKPVLCRDCFGQGGNRGPERRNDSPRENRRDSFREPKREPMQEKKIGVTKEQFDELSVKFEGLNAKFEGLNVKLDKILKFVTPVIKVSKEMQAVAAKKPTKRVPKAAKVTTPKKSKGKGTKKA